MGSRVPAADEVYRGMSIVLLYCSKSEKNCQKSNMGRSVHANGNTLMRSANHVYKKCPSKAAGIWILEAGANPL
jgi:hypothetical protein